MSVSNEKRYKTLERCLSSRPSLESLKKRVIIQKNIFGQTLTELTTKEKTTVPIFVKKCIQLIQTTEDHLITPGLFRISARNYDHRI